MGFPKLATSEAFVDYSITGGIFSEQENKDIVKDYTDPRTTVILSDNVNYLISGLTNNHCYSFYFNNLSSRIARIVLDPSGGAENVVTDLVDDSCLDPFQQVHRAIVRDVCPQGGNNVSLRLRSQSGIAMTLESLTVIDEGDIQQLDNNGFFTFPLSYDLNTTILANELGGGQYEQKPREIAPGLKIDITPIAKGGQNIKGSYLSNMMRTFHRLGSDLFMDFNTQEHWQAYIGQIQNLPRVSVNKEESGFIKFSAIQFVTKW